jgi:DNA-binding MarR family transcriptional regulator
MNKSEPSHLEDHMGYWLRCLSNFVSRSFAEKLAGEGISVAQWVVLRTLYGCPSMTLKQTAEKVGVDNSSLSRVVEKLVLRGLVDRAVGTDRRSVRLSLTHSGHSIVPVLAKLADDNDHAFFQGLSAKQRKELLSIIKKLLKENRWQLSDHGWEGLQ